MLKKFFDYISPKPTDDSSANVVPSERFGFGNKNISSGSLKVIRELQKEGFQAYLVGGGVRDLCLGRNPKDFDVGTNATPEQVKQVFNRARIIGRRFQIVHVRIGREIIEVTTFRANHQSAGNAGQAKQSENGILLRDNVYGDIESDAERRDFTVNALYYDPSTEHIHDFCKGLDDIESRQLRVIGDPETRYKEDPVRLLRAARFAAKLGFSLEAETEKPIRELSEYLSHIPPARLFEEVLKLFMSGDAQKTLALLRDYNLLAYLFPATAQCMDDGDEKDIALITFATRNTDKRIKQNLRVTPAFIYAAMLWPALKKQSDYYVQEHKLSPQEAMQRASHGVISQQLSFTSIPKRFLIPMREIWELQLRLQKRDGKKAFAIQEHPRFRAAYDFLLLREQSGENLDNLGVWWTKFQDASEAEKQQLVRTTTKNSGRKRRPRRKPSAPAKDANG